MTTTYGALQTKVARSLRDEGNKSFTTQVVKDMIAAAWAEVGDIVPYQFQEDITPIADTLSYQLQAAVFTDPVDSIQVQRVELWDGSQTPNVAWRFVEPASSHPTGLSYSQAGWRVWHGSLELPNRVEQLIDPDTHIIRVWGYSPYPPVSADDDQCPFGPDIEEAIVLVCYIEGLRRLIGNRALFTQWQTRSNNTDVSLASLASDFNLAMEEWRRKQRRLLTLREAP